ncbi:hypothetical protein RI129_001036 [Pyrocoelia pectoralis]|uniref:DUF7041 domain-containing protein n=1 Tax=Pyrocoelia pectoralis TaxID=417401 RepID=A0AAN7VK08_9COLE
MSEEQKEVSRVTLKLPPFWKRNPTVWFTQVESQFIIANITADVTKYHYVIAAIDSNILSEVSDIILKPPTVGMYSTLKNQLISRFTESQERRVNKLLHDLELGDKRPSQLLREMSDLAQDKITDSLLKTLWLQRLPKNIQTILIVSEDTLEKLATMADKIMDTNSCNSTINEVEQKSETQELRSQIAELSAQIEALKGNRFNRTQSTEYRQRQRSTSRTRSSDFNRLCWYHYRFGKEAKRCTPPCNFQKNLN